MSILEIRGVRSWIDGRWYEGPIAIEAGRVARLGDGPSDLRADLADHRLVALPGLVNGHDHLDFGDFPLLAGNAPYADYVAWAEDVTARRAAGELLSYEKLPLARRLVSSAIRNLRSGVTSVGHMNPYLRRVFDRGAFPVRVLGEGRCFHSLQFGGDLGAFLRRTRGRPYMTHVAEGRSERSRSELARLGAVPGALGPWSILAHGLGLSRDDARRVQSAGATLVLCPRSNATLYGAGPDVPMLQEEGVRLALGSDSPISGPGDLLEDLDAARKLGLDEAAAMDAVTRIPAATFGRPDLGVLRTGAPADLLFADAADADLGKGRASVAMVMTAGIARYASRAGLIAATGREETALGGGGWVEARLGRWASKLSAGSPPAT